MMPIPMFGRYSGNAGARETSFRRRARVHPPRTVSEEDHCWGLLQRPSVRQRGRSDLHRSEGRIVVFVFGGLPGVAPTGRRTHLAERSHWEWLRAAASVGYV